MKFLLVFLLFLSFAECPSLLPILEDSHSIRFENEHGVFHLILFHEADETPLTTISSPLSEENHEFHLSTESALIKKAVETSFPKKQITLANNYSNMAATSEVLSENLFETDIGTFSPPTLVLRI
jgi:hypothetical protein